MSPKPYQREPDELRPIIWEQGSITPWQLLRICAWKSARANLAGLALNTEEVIAERTAHAVSAVAPFRHDDAVTKPVDWDRWEDAVRSAIGSDAAKTGLLGLEGVGYPTATAILCILNPRVFPVMDRWTVPCVFTGAPRVHAAYFGAGYRAFTQHLVGLSRSQFQGASVHEVDQRLMNAARDGEPIQVPRVPLPPR